METELFFESTKPRYLVIQSNHGNHSGHNRKWKEREYFYKLTDAQAYANDLNEEIGEELVRVEILELGIQDLKSSQHPFNFFDGKANGNLPGFLIETLKEIHAEAEELAKELATMARDADPSDYERLNSY